jgi:hypothetical protein
MYEYEYLTLHGLRILAVDGSRIFLPENHATIKEFGTMAYLSKITDSSGEHCCARASVLYDVLNKVALHARLAPIATSELKLAEDHLSHVNNNDLVIYDRFYASYRMLAIAQVYQGDFLVRCSKASFKIVREMFAGKTPDDVTVTLKPNSKTNMSINNQTLPSNLVVRFVRIRLNSGEYEVLATSLTDKNKYPHSIFAELYNCRWGVETFYGKLKTRLDLENFSGISVEAVLQDFYVAVLLTGIETIFTEDSETWLKRQKGGHAKQINKAVSFNTIKQHAFEIFMSDEPPDELLDKLTRLFVTNPVTRRPGRKSPRGRLSPSARLNFVRRRRKIVF